MVTKWCNCKLGRPKNAPVSRILQQFFNYLSKSDFLCNFQPCNGIISTSGAALILAEDDLSSKLFSLLTYDREYRLQVNRLEA